MVLYLEHCREKEVLCSIAFTVLEVVVVVVIKERAPMQGRIM